MKVGELKKLLDSHDENADVILSSDEEGNDFLTLHDVSGELYASDIGEIHILAPDDADDEYEIDEIKKAVVLWP